MTPKKTTKKADGTSHDDDTLDTSPESPHALEAPRASTTPTPIDPSHPIHTLAERVESLRQAKAAPTPAQKPAFEFPTPKDPTKAHVVHATKNMEKAKTSSQQSFSTPTPATSTSVVRTTPNQVTITSSATKVTKK